MLRLMSRLEKYDRSLWGIGKTNSSGLELDGFWLYGQKGPLPDTLTD